jgi:hypothetical protein
MTSYTNTSLATARRCLTEYDLAYNQQLEPVAADAEALQVGQTWHKAFHVAHKGDDPYEAIAKHAPGPLWNEKVRRLYAAYHWYWESQALELEEAEPSFRIEFAGITWEGQIDGIVRLADGRRGILERKTGSDPLDAGSMYWDRLRLNVQVGLYAIACGFVPSFILYDVVRKPTINPKNLTKADRARLGKDLQKEGAGLYHEMFTAEQLAGPLEEGRESIELYGARLTADIGNRPDYYFARREVTRTQQDYDTLLDNLRAQVAVIQYAQDNSLMHRNPDSCALFSRCKFFGLCSNNIRPREGGPAPDGFRRREHLHPELA